MNPGVRLRVGHQRSQFWPILVRFFDYYLPFWGPEVIFIVIEPQGALTCRSSTLQFWPILARFMDYYSLFWGPGVMSTIDESRGAFMCRSATLLVFVNSDPFRGLLLTVLGPE